MKNSHRMIRLNFISWLRAFAVLCILICHLCTEAPIGVIQSLGQLFNIGVQIFLIISAFCFGYQGDISNVKQWYIKRIKRIVCPYEIFLIVLLIIYWLKNFKIPWLNWISCVFFAQGMNVGVLGAGQTWFMTTLIICYILTPFIAKIWGRVRNKQNEIMTIISLFVFPFIMAYALPHYIFIIVYHICFYSIVYWVGKHWNKIRINGKSIMIYTGVMIIVFLIRLIGRRMFDGTNLYDLVIVNYTHYIAAGCIFMIFAWVFSRITPLKLIEIIDRTSFEIYLYHYMFIVGPVSVMKITNSWIINSIIVVCVAFLCAIILHKISKRIQQIIL